MNNEDMKLLTYKNIDVAKLVSLLSHTKINLLVIGRHNSRVINSRAILKDYIVGIKCAASLTSKASNI